ncbi:MAG: TROVE domain-containing protein [Phototrophicaceae bacterium]
MDCVMKKYLTQIMKDQVIPTPQSEAISGTNQIPNSAGGYVWSVDMWEQLNRFLILGSEGGSYYASQKNLSIENAQNVLACIQADGIKTVETIVELSSNGRAPKNDPAIFALALASSIGDDATRRLALNSIPKVCRTATHLFGFVEVIKEMRGWGRGLRNAISAWYTEKDNQKLAYQVVKYRQRNGWTHRDTLRKAHPIASNPEQAEIFKWITQPDNVAWKDNPVQPENDGQAFIWAYERAQKATDVKTVLKLIQDYNLPREALPTNFLNEAEIWDALLQKMPMTAMIRNLGNMSKHGLLVPNSEAEKIVTERLADVDRLRWARVHPIQILSALRVYAGGRALRGGRNIFAQRQTGNDWKPTPLVVDALDTAFELAFQTIEPSNKRTMIALDVSGSMSMGMIAGVAGLTPREGSAAMAMVTARTEANYMFTAFQSEMVDLNISAKMRLDTVIKTISNLPFWATDCAQPMLYAMEKKYAVDTFVIYTDSETWFGKVHPVQALQQYRNAMGIPAKLIVVGMVANRFTIADPNDKGMLDVVGFDSSAPNVMNAFVRGEI